MPPRRIKLHTTEKESNFSTCNSTRPPSPLWTPTVFMACRLLQIAPLGPGRPVQTKMDLLAAWPDATTDCLKLDYPPAPRRRARNRHRDQHVHVICQSLHIGQNAASQSKPPGPYYCFALGNALTLRSTASPTHPESSSQTRASHLLSRRCIFRGEESICLREAEAKKTAPYRLLVRSLCIRSFIWTNH